MKELSSLIDGTGESSLPNRPSTSEIIAIEKDPNQRTCHRKRRFANLTKRFTSRSPDCLCRDEKNLSTKK